MKGSYALVFYFIYFLTGPRAWAAQMKECAGEKTLLLGEFVLSDLDTKSKVGLDEVEPLRKKIVSFIKDNPQFFVTDVSVTASSAKTPFFIQHGKKKIIDPKSEERNLGLAKDRARFVNQVFKDLSSSGANFEKIQFQSSSALGGPDFVPLDLNDRFVTKLSPGYAERVKELYHKNSELYLRDANLSTSDTLLNESDFGNLYQVKFKPFHGYKLQISGYKCLGRKTQDLSIPSTTRQ